MDFELASDIKRRWDPRHISPPGRPDPFLVERVCDLRAGSVLDIACGTGRNALYLAGLEYDVTGVDISPAGLTQLKAAASARGLTVKTIEADLRQSRPWGQYNNGIIFNYLPPLSLLESLHEYVIPGGTLILCTFTTKNGERFNPSYCIEERAFAQGLPLFRLMHHSENMLDGRFRDGYVFRRT